jgi:hypothetical protein
LPIHLSRSAIVTLLSLSLKILSLLALLCAAAARLTLRPDGIPDHAYPVTTIDVLLAVPEPASFGMLMAGLGLVGSAARCRAG